MGCQPLLQENRVVLPEPYRTFIAEISNGSSLGPAGDGGLQPLGWLPDTGPTLARNNQANHSPWGQRGHGKTTRVPRVGAALARRPRLVGLNAPC